MSTKTKKSKTDKSEKASGSPKKRSKSFGTIKKVSLALPSYEVEEVSVWAGYTSPCTTGGGTSSPYGCCCC